MGEHMQRKEKDLSQASKKLLIWFLLIYTVHPTIYFLSLLSAIGLKDFMTIFKIIGLYLAPPIVITFTLLFFILNRKLKKKIATLDQDTRNLGSMEKFVNTFALKAFLYMTIGCGGGPILTVIMGYYFEIINSWQQVTFFILIGELTAFIAGALVFHIIKTTLYPMNEYISYKPLSLFHKFSIPIGSAILLLLCLISVGIYKLGVSQTTDRFEKDMQLKVEKSSLIINGFLENCITELEAYSKSDILGTVDLEKSKPVLMKLHQNRYDYIEMYLIANKNGDALNTLTNTVINISDRPYFKEIMKTGKPFISEPVVSRASNKDIIVAGIPIKSGNEIIGIIGASILIDTINNELYNGRKSGVEDYMILNRDGKINFFAKKEFINKTIMTDIKDDKHNMIHIERLLNADDKKFFSLHFDGRKKIAYKDDLSYWNKKIILIINQSEYMGALNDVILQIGIALCVITIMLLYIILRITNKLSGPIKRTIEIFRKISEGDLTVESDDYIPDEFGELLRHLKRLIFKLNEVINITVDSAQQLATSSENLSATSQNLAQSAQGQAASVEESSASLEQITASIDQIAQNAKLQSEHATLTYQSMEKLKTIIQQVATYASEALDKANISREEAKNGNELMQHTIEGMNSIDESTQKIAEIMNVITDISDKVNLLALNAAIEAARAGEHGRGFAVVSDEISKLAEQTASSAKLITDLVRSGLDNVHRGRNDVNNTSQALSSIIDNISKTDELVHKIAIATQDQTESSNMVLKDTRQVMEMADSISVATSEQMHTNTEMIKAIDQINELTQGVAAGAEEIASSSEEISAQAEALNEHIEFFKVKKDVD